MSVKTALITGIAGQDGVYLSRFLLAKGYRVVGTSSPASTGLRRLGTYLDDVEVVSVDLRDGVGMQELIMGTRPDGDLQPGCHKLCWGILAARGRGR